VPLFLPLPFLTLQVNYSIKSFGCQAQIGRKIFVYFFLKKGIDKSEANVV
jgi:hypothetical protein